MPDDRIEKRIDAVLEKCSSIAETQAAQSEKLTSIKDTVGNMKAVMDGNGAGLKTKVDRLRENEKRRTWQIRALFVGFVGWVVNVVMDLWKR